VIVYLTMGLVALLSDWIWRDAPFASWQGTLPDSNFIWLTAGLYVFFNVAGGIFCMAFFRWGQSLEKIFQQMLTPISYFQILILSFLSGFVEEWFFRGVLSTHLGIILSSVFFALAHFIPSRRVLYWAAWALQAGIVLAIIYQKTQSLLFVALMHTAINFVFLLKLNNSAHRAATSHA